MKAKVIKTGEIVEVYHEHQHGQITNIYKEAVLVNGRMWDETELDFNCITKANKAPEKIYLHPTAKGEVGASWLTFPLTNEDVEYTRTDAFIEKVCNLLSRMVWEVTYEDLEGDSVEHYDKTEFIEEIRKYMKGE